MADSIALHALKTAICERFESIQRVLEDGTREKVVLEDKYRSAGDEVNKQLARIITGIERLDAAENADDFDAIANRLIQITQHDLGGALVVLAKSYLSAVRQSAGF